MFLPKNAENLTQDNSLGVIVCFAVAFLSNLFCQNLMVALNVFCFPSSVKKIGYELSRGQRLFLTKVEG